jgi:hypothetical protein
MKLELLGKVRRFGVCRLREGPRQIARLRAESGLGVEETGLIGVVGTTTVEDRLRESCCVKLSVEDRRRCVEKVVLCTSTVGSTRSCVSSVGRGNSVCSNGHTLISRSICMKFVLRCGFTHNFNE